MGGGPLPATLLHGTMPFALYNRRKYLIRLGSYWQKRFTITPVVWQGFDDDYNASLSPALSELSIIPMRSSSCLPIWNHPSFSACYFLSIQHPPYFSWVRGSPFPVLSPHQLMELYVYLELNSSKRPPSITFNAELLFQGAMISTREPRACDVTLQELFQSAKLNQIRSLLTNLIVPKSIMISMIFWTKLSIWIFRGILMNDMVVYRKPPILMILMIA